MKTHKRLKYERFLISFTQSEKRFLVLYKYVFPSVALLKAIYAQNVHSCIWSKGKKSVHTLNS